MDTKQQFPTTTNPGWGFYGTMRGYAEIAWPLAMTAIADATGENHDSVRAFLDGRPGRHFANEVLDLVDGKTPMADAIAAVATRWMAWRTTRRMSHNDGIPAGLPYLTGMVIACAIDEEDAA